MKNRILKILLRDNPKHWVVLILLARTVAEYIVKTTPRGATFIDLLGRTQTSGITYSDVDAYGYVEFWWGYDPIASANSKNLQRRAISAFEAELLERVAALNLGINTEKLYFTQKGGRKLDVDDMKKIQLKRALKQLLREKSKCV